MHYSCNERDPSWWRWRFTDLARGNAAKIDVAVIKAEHFYTQLAHCTRIMCNARAAA